MTKLAIFIGMIVVFVIVGAILFDSNDWWDPKH